MPTILTVASSGSGHSNSINSLKKWIGSRYKNINWIHHQTYHDYSYSQDPKVFAYYQLDKRVQALEKVLVDKIDLIIYDFFSPEALLLKLKLKSKIPIMCSIPAQMGHHFTDSPQNVSDVYNLPFPAPLLSELSLYKISDGYHLHHSKTINLVWNYPEIGSGYLNLPNSLPNPENWHFLGSGTNLTKPVQDLDKVFVYCSLGTVVPTSLCDLNPEAQTLVRKIYERVLDMKVDWDITKVISCPDNLNLSHNLPTDLDVNQAIIGSTIDQNNVLDQSEFFVTHGGGNSFQEALSRKVPMIVLPFFGDQHVVAQMVEDHGLGINLFKGIFSESRPHTISELTPEILSKMIDRVKTLDETLLDWKAIPDNFDRLNLAKQPEIEEKLTSLFSQFHPKDAFIKDQFQSGFKKGDLLYGTNRDRIKFVESLGLSDQFQIGKENNQVYTTFEELDIEYPKMIDQWNDLLRKYSLSELQNLKKHPRISLIHAELINYRSTIERDLDGITDQAIKVQNKNLLHICCIGMIHFLSKGSKIHFVLDSYNSEKNIGTKLEIDCLLGFLANNPEASDLVIIWKRNNVTDQWENHPITLLTNSEIDFNSLEEQYTAMLPTFQETRARLEILIKGFLDQFRSRGSENYWVQSRVKTFESYRSRIVDRLDDPNKIFDLIGFRIIHPSSAHLEGLIERLEYYFQSHGYLVKRKKTHPTYLYFSGTFGSEFEQFVEIQFWPLIEYYGFISEYDLTYKSNYETHSKLNQDLHQNLLKMQSELQKEIDQHPFWNVLGAIEDEKAKLGVFDADQF